MYIKINITEFYMHTKIYSEALYGIEGIPIVIEVNISEGLPKFDVVGLPDQAVNEAKERVIAAINNSDRFFPPKRITINFLEETFPKNRIESNCAMEGAFTTHSLLNKESGHECARINIQWVKI